MELKKNNGLPFAKRWLEKEFGTAKTNFALRMLRKANCVEEHPPLCDQNRGIVSQAEHTVVVLEKPVITTWHEE